MRKSELAALTHDFRRIAVVACCCLLSAAIGCGPRTYSPGKLLERAGDEIVVCGQLFHTGTPVVLWMDPGGYDAYRVEKRFENPRLAATQPAAASQAAEAPARARYGAWRRHLPADEWDAVWRDGWTLERLRKHVDLFVIHYDVCGTSRQCFKVLQDRRNLSVHFMLDIDGTIYQTLDLKERAWHAGTANDRSVGVEIANIGAYPPPKSGEGARGLPKILAEWYEPDGGGGVRIRLPAAMGDGGVRTAGFIGRPARPLVTGAVHGRALAQFDLTDEQYAALIRLTATLSRVLPRIRPDCPRDAAGKPRWDVLSAEEMTGFSGLIGHYHVTTDKVDPGPAFDWERLIAGVRRATR